MIFGQTSAAPAGWAGAIATHYDSLDPFYRAIWGEHVHHGLWETGRETAEEAVIAMAAFVARAASIGPGDRVCDIGCGYGAAARFLAERFQAQVTGLTLSRKQWEYANARSAADPRLVFLLRDWLENKLEAESCDRVIAIESAEHMQDKARFFQEAHRVLRPGGRVALTTWLARHGPNGVESRFLLQPICVEGRLPSLASAEEVRLLMKEAGFRNIDFEELTSRVAKTWSVCLRRFTRTLFRDPRLRRALADPDFSERAFAKTIFRMWVGYRTGTVRYGIFCADR